MYLTVPFSSALKRGFGLFVISREKTGPGTETVQRGRSYLHLVYGRHDSSAAVLPSKRTAAPNGAYSSLSTGYAASETI